MARISKFFILIFVIIISACGSTKQKGSLQESVVDSALFYAVSTKFIEAKRHMYQGDTQGAAKGFEACIKMNPRHDASMYELARLYENANPKFAIELCQRAIDIDPKNIWYYELLLRIFQQQKLFEKAVIVNKSLIELEPDNKDYYYQLANLYILNKDYKKALFVYNQIVDNFGYEDGVLRQIKQIYLKQGDYNRAISTLEKMIEHSPKNKDYYGMIAEIYSNQGKYNKALEYYHKILEIDSDDGFVHFALADYYRAMNDNTKAIEELTKGMKSPSLDINSKMKVLLGMHDVIKTDTSFTKDFEKLLSIALDVNPKEPKVLALKADYLMETNKIESAVLYYRKVLTEDSSKYVIWERLLDLEARLKDYNAMEAESERALHLFPQQPLLYYYNAVALSKLGDWKKAKERISMGSNFVYDMSQKANFFALRAKAEMQLGEVDNSRANFERAISIDNNNGAIKKDYAFALASHNIALEDAVKYAKDALELDFDNPEYIYVYVYCLFKNGEKDTAIQWLEPAMKRYPENKKLRLLDMEINKNE